MQRISIALSALSRE